MFATRKLVKHNAFKATRLFTASTVSWDYDVVVSGGGVVGAAFAASLLNKSNGKCKIAIIENKPPMELKVDKSLPDIRVYALSPKSIKFLQQTGAWKYVDTRSHSYGKMQIWESNGPGVVRFKADDVNAEELGRTCEDVTIQAALYQAMKDAGHSVDFIYGSSVSDIRITAGDMDLVRPAKVTISKNKAPTDKSPPENRVVTTRLLVGADGAMSAVRRLCGVPTWGWGYGQEAVVATVKLKGWEEKTSTAVSEVNGQTGNGDDQSTSSKPPVPPPPPNDTAWQRYLPTGPLALLPLWDGHCSIVWSSNVTEVKRIKSLSKEDFLSELNAALQSPSLIDKWSVLDSADGTGLPPFINSVFNKVQNATNIFGEGGASRGLNILQRAKREVASLADTAMSAALLSDPPQSPPVVSSIESARISFPLSFSQARTYVTPRVALIGDAAHSIHPQAGQGLNLGLLDAECLADVVVDCMKVGADYGDIHALTKGYHDVRYPRNLAMMGTVDGINRMFKDGTALYSNVTPFDRGVEGDATTNTNRDPPHIARDMTPSDGSKAKQFLRSLGMLAVHGLAPAKNRMAAYAMGLESNGHESKK